MDNLPAHKVHGVRQAIEAAGASLRYLPPYSPDFNPIEMAFAKLRPRCAPPKREPSPTSGKPSPTLCADSPRKNAPTISPPQVTTRVRIEKRIAALLATQGVRKRPSLRSKRPADPPFLARAVGR